MLVLVEPARSTAFGNHDHVHPDIASPLLYWSLKRDCDKVWCAAPSALAEVIKYIITE
jgi:hypothetical protein